MKKRNSWAIFFASSLLIAGMVSAFTACNFQETGPESEGEKGFSVVPETGVEAVVSPSYRGKDEAARAFVENELSGAAAKTAFSSYEKTADLTQEERAALGVGETYTGGEKGYVFYTASAPAEGQALAASDRTEKHTVVLLFGAGGEISYCVVPPQIGEAVPKSYFEGVQQLFLAENVTYVLETVSEMGVSGTVQTASMKAELRVTKDVIYEKTEFTPDARGETDLYIVQDGDSFVGYNAVGETWAEGVRKPGTLADWYRDEVASKAASESAKGPVFDHTFYVRTQEGCALDERKKDLFIAAFMENIPALAMVPSQMFQVELSMQFRDGKLSSMVQRLLCEFPGPDGSSMKIRAETVSRIYDYGTTAVEIPESLKAVIENGK